jgi:hypothetical protein
MKGGEEDGEDNEGRVEEEGDDGSWREVEDKIEEEGKFKVEDTKEDDDGGSKCEKEDV